jgi:F0F1-type ATP synthase delta subunit
MKRMSRSQIAQLFLTLYEKESKQTAVKALAHLIMREKRQNDLDFIVNEIGTLHFKQTGHLNVAVTTAHVVSNDLLEKIKNHFLTTTRAKTISLTHSIDPKIIGGFIASTPTQELNASIHQQINAWRFHV